MTSRLRLSFSSPIVHWLAAHPNRSFKGLRCFLGAAFALGCMACWDIDLYDDAGEPGGPVSCSTDDECGAGELCQNNVCQLGSVIPPDGGGDGDGDGDGDLEDAGPPGSGILASVPDGVIEFGAQRIGIPVERQVALVNVGTAPLTILQVVLESLESNEFTASPTGFFDTVLDPQDAMIIQVVHTPADGTPDMASLKIVHSDSGDTFFTVDLIAEFKGNPDIHIHPDLYGIVGGVPAEEGIPADGGSETDGGAETDGGSETDGGAETDGGDIDGGDFMIDGGGMTGEETVSTEGLTDFQFADTYVGLTTTQDFYLRNMGASDSVLVIDNLVITPAEGDFVLELDSFSGVHLPSFEGFCDTDAECDEDHPTCTHGLCVNAEGMTPDTLLIPLSFTPGTGGTIQGTLTLFYQDSGEVAQWDFPISGEGITCTARDGASFVQMGEECTYTCLENYYDLNGDLNEMVSDGCEYACVFVSTTDLPDGNFIDANCDGMDGVIPDGVFVAPTGSDASDCTMGVPCLTLNNAVTEMSNQGKQLIFVQAGDYSEVVHLPAGAFMAGGYDASWARDDHDLAEHHVEITGGWDATYGQYLTLVTTFGASACQDACGTGNALVNDGNCDDGAYGHDSTGCTFGTDCTDCGVRYNETPEAKDEVTIMDLEIVGPNASDADANGPHSSHGVVALNGLLKLERISITQGNGADGTSGSDGVSAPDTSVANGGTNGGNADEFSTSCNTNYTGGGGGGSNSCSADGYETSPNAGGGGLGGSMDTSCFLGFCDNCNARSGTNGINGSTTYEDLTYSHGGSGGGTCSSGTAGQPGRIMNGIAGVGGSADGRIRGSFWYGFAGESGGLGRHGSGGGGGGGSGGCDDGIDSTGAGGGGGGAGGCRATDSAIGGSGGGSSFGVFSFFGGVALKDVTFVRSNGGKGGDGGLGGQGQSGGPGGAGGLADGDSLAGSPGAAGAHGGHGGGGGGGSGGLSVGSFHFGGSITQEGSNTFTSGAGGTAGQGGASAPDAPVADGDGSDGTNGAAGAVEEVKSCSKPVGC